MSILCISLEDCFRQVAVQYCNDTVTTDNEWRYIVQCHNNKSRHYHNLNHLQDVIQQLTDSKDEEVWPAFVLATVYHDIIYSVTAKDNEEQSARIAIERMQRMKVPDDMISRVERCILATKSHERTGDMVTDRFTDADMSILGRAWDVYEQYAQQVREEYRIYPDLLYNPGRKKVLHSFLAMDRIFKTAYFYDKYEQAARENIKMEADRL